MGFFTLLRVVFSERKLSAALFFILAGLTFLFFYLVRDKVSTRADLVEVKSILGNCSFVEDRGIRYHTFEYFIALDGYRAQFQISADFSSLFYKEDFTKEVKQGDTVNVLIKKSEFKNVQRPKNIFVFGISTQRRNYLEDRFTIPEYNSSLRLYAGLAFIMVGAFLFFNNREKLKIP